MPVGLGYRNGKLRRVLLSGASPAVLGAFLVVVSQAQAADITISTSITTGTLWSGTAAPGSNLTVTPSGTINTANAYGITITGTAGSQLGTLLNNGSIIDTAANGRAVFVQAGSIGAVINSGTISASTYALWNAGSIGSMSNSGLISGRLVNQSTIGNFTNSGTLTYTSFTWDNESQIKTFTNSGLIYGDRAVYSQGTIGTLINTRTGTIQGTINAITITGVGGINSISNSGQIIGNILNSGTITPTISGGASTTIGTITGNLGTVGTITSANAGLVFSSGNISLNDNINVGTNTVTNTGASLSIANTLTITGTLAQTAGTLTVRAGGGQLVVNNPVSITGGTIRASTSSISNYLAGNYTVISAGAGSNYTGASVVTSSLTGLYASTSVSGNNVVLTANNDYIGGTLATLSNTGTISGQKTALYVAATGSVGSLTNTGTLSGSTRGIFINFGGQIGTISNQGRIVAVGGAGAAGGIADAGTIAVINNSGTIISGASSGIGLNQNVSSIGTIINSGVIRAFTGAIYDQGTIGTVINSGQLLSTNTGISINGGTMGALLNSGTIAAPRAIFNSGSLGPVTDSGVIAGSIENSSAFGLTIGGGTGATIGTLTGATFTSMGSIINTLSNLTFNTGNLLLNDRINAAGHTVANTGASILLNTIVSITGAYNQSAGTLVIAPTQGGLIVSGAANLSGGTVVSSFSSTGNYLASVNTLVSGSSLSLAGATVSIASITGLYDSSSTVSNRLLLTVSNDYVGGTLATLNNSASITSASTGLYVAATGSVGTLTNSGTLGGGQFAINNLGTIGTLLNSGSITNSNFTALWNQGSIGQLTNTGTISNNSWAINNNGSIGTVTNSGVIAGAANAIQNYSAIGLIDNSGTMSGGSNAIAGGIIGTIVNSGLILGNISKDGGASLGTIIGGSAGTVGTFTGFSGGTQGTIGVTGNLAFASGSLLLNDSIAAKGVAASAVTISNNGADITLSTIVNVDANFRQTAGTINLGSTGELVVTQAASITGGTVAVDSGALSSNATYLAGSAGNTLVVGGTGSNYTGVNVSLTGGVTGLAATGVASGNNLVLGIANDYIGDTQASVANTGTISGVGYAAYIASTGTIGTFTNTGTLSGSNSGFSNNGSIGTVSNSGLITSSVKGFGNQSTIGLVDNAVGGTILGGTAAGFQNDTQLGTLSNAGLISSGSAGVADYGTMGQLINTGSINGGPQGIYVDGSGSIGSLNNSGTITAAQSAIQVSGTLGTLANSGVIANATNAINLAGTLTTLINLAGGTISGSNALYLTGTLGGLSDSGVIRGTIDNESANALTITGAAAGTIGTLTGQSGRGTIVGTLSNLVFASGNLLLNDNIIATGHTVSNTGAALTLNTIVNIAGNYSQTGGTLSVTPGNSSLIVTGTAAITGGTIAASLSATGNYLTGTPSTLVAGGAGSSYSATLDSNSITGLVSSIASSGNNLVLSYGNDYVGGSLAAITNTGALSATTAVYIAATGSLGALHNSGTITGNIVNLSGHALSITGGSGATIGSLTGGTITSTGANVVLASGNLLLGDAVDVGGGIVVNGGASVQLPSALTITGNYAQNAGTLDVGSNVLSVTGAASITGGTVAASLVSTANYLVGTGGATLVAGGAGSNYTGVTVTAGTLTGLATMSSISGNNLVLAIGNDYIGGSLASIGNTGTISGVSYAAYIAATGTVGTFTNSGTLSGSANGFANNGSIGTVSNTGLISSTSNALDNNGTIDFVTIGVAGTIHGAIGAALWNEAGHGIGTLNNAGNLISDSAAGVADYGAIGVLSNTGTINGFAQAVYIDASGSVGALGNSGTITADQNAIQLAGTMGTLTNSGFISSAAAAVDVSGNLGTLLNLAGGTLSGPTALAVSGTLGGLANSGLILGSIVNTGTGDLAISGGTGATIGTLTGASLAVPGAISNTLANVTLSGNLLLNDDIDAGSHTVTNSGANLTLNSIISVTGDYRQSGGTITITPGTSGLDVSGAANVANARIVTTLSGTGNYLAGAIATVISAGAASSYTSDTVVTNNITGLNAGGSASGNDYLLVANNDYVGGTLASLNNTATITGPSTGLYVATTGSIGTLTNSGTLGGGQFGVNNRGTIDTLSNSGRITNNNFTALWNQGSIGQLTNTGTITNSSWAIHNTGTIGTLTNSGVVSGAGNAIQNDGVVTLLSNSGTMSGGSNVIAGNFATIANSGLIQGNINKDGGANVGTIIGGSAGTVGTFTGFSGGTQGTIGATGNLVFASGDLLLNDSITAAGISESALTISNAGANITLSTIVNVTGNFRQTGGGIDLGSSGELVVSQAASIIGGSVVASGLSSTGIYLAGTQISTLIAGGAGSNYTGVNVSIAGAVVGPAANGLVSGNNLVLGVSNDYIGGSIASVANTGTISGVSYAVFVASTGTIGTFTNTGTLSGSNSGFSNNGSVGTVSNSGLITSSVKGFGNQSTIGLVDNAVGGTILGGTAAGFQNDTQLGTLTNAGLISSGSAGVADYGTMGQLINTGSINGGPQGIYVDGSGSIGSLNNSGTITAAQSAIQVSGTLGTLVNSGVIANATNAINVAGTLATLINLAGGTISGSNALYLTGTLGGLSDSGVIRGTIDNESANALTITGAAAGTIGTLTGQSGRGTIVGTLSNLIFASGNLLLNDDIIATGHTVANSGAALTLNTIVNVTGNYSQTGGTLAVTPGTSRLAVSGSASVTGGTILASLSSTGNYLSGTIATLVSAGAASSYAGANVVTSSVTGLTVASSIGGNNLLLVAGNDYIGGTLANLSNTGALTAATAVYIAATGNLGTLTNSGSITGNVTNLSANNLTINGGSAGTVGGFSGGTIANTLSSLVIASGNLLLGDAVDVAGHSLTHSGGNVTLANIVTITGNYSQTGGALDIGQNHLVVSGAASLTGGTLQANLPATANYLAGSVAGTLVAGGGGSNYAGVSISATSGPGLVLSSTTVGNNLVAMAGNDYVGGTLASLGNTGLLSATTAVYIAATGSLATLANTGIIAGDIRNLSAHDLTVTGGAGATIGTLTGLASAKGSITNSLSNLIFASGNIVLNDDVNVGSFTASNSGANLALAGVVSITGNYAQSGGTLGLDPGTSELVVSGHANFTGGTVLASVSGTGNYLAGTGYTLIQGGVGSSLAGANVSTGGLTGLGVATSVTTISSIQTLRLAVTNDYIGGSLASLANTGSISSGYGLYVANTGSLGSLANSGTLAGSIAAIHTDGVLGPITNTGVIAGDIENSAASSLSITGGSGATIGTLTGFIPGSQGTIRNTLGNVVLADNLALNDGINVGSNTVTNAGGSLLLNSIVSITGNYSQASGILDVGVNHLAVSGAAVLSGGTVQTSLSSAANYIAGAAAATVVTAGAGSNYAGVAVAPNAITGLALAGATSGNNLVVNAGNDYVGASLASLANTGSISSGYGLYVANTGSLGSLANSGTLAGSIAAIHTDGTLGPITNTGVIAGDIENSTAGSLSITGGSGATIGTLTGFTPGTEGTIRNTLGNVTLAGNLALNDAINVGSNTVTNAGGSLLLNSIVSITGNYSQASGDLTIASGAELAVSGAAVFTGGTIAAGLSGANNYLVTGSGGTLVAGGAGSSYTGVALAGGTIAGLAVAAITSGNSLVVNVGNDYIGGSLASLANTGSISSGYGLYVANTGSLGSLANSGTLAGSIAAIHTDGTLGPISNTGVIAGDIENSTASSLGITGGSGATIGTLTGFTPGTQGTIRNTLGNVTLAGNLALNDDINVGTNTVTNAGGSLLLNSIVNVTGNYSQASGTLNVGANHLAVSGAAVLSGGTVQTSFATTGNYVVGTPMATLVTGGTGSNYTGVAVSTGAVAGLALNGATSGNDLVVNAGNDYVGASLASLANTGSISSGYGLYVANTGSLGDLVNSGTLAGSIAAIHSDGTLGPITNAGVIAGDIENSTAGSLSITGGGGATIGTLTGFTPGSQGTIRNTLGNVTLAANLALNDSINVGANTVTNAGGALLLDSIVSITGNYSQASGDLTIASGAELAVSGAAVFTGGTIAAGLAGANNYLVTGSGGTLVAGGAGSNYAGVTLAGASITGLSASAATVGNNLVVAAGNDYIGGSLASLANTGSISSGYGLYVANTGSLGSLSNSGTLAGSIAAIHNDGTLGSIVNTGVIAGDIENSTASSLSITGGSGATIGTLTGFMPGSQGTIRNTLGDVVLAGNLVLNDAINVGTNTVSNAGGSLVLTSIVGITGNYSQASGTLNVGANQLVVSGAASITGGTVQASLSSLANYIAGVTAGTVVTGGAGSNYTGVAASAGPLTGLALDAATSGNDLVVNAGNDYIGGSLASLSNTGSISSGYGLYVASTGSLGSLANSGTLAGSIAAIHSDGTLGPIVNTGVIAGDIENNSAGELDISGGAGSVGTLTGFAPDGQGTITNTLSDVNFVTGQLLLNDNVNLGGHTLINSGATLQLNNTVRVAGNFSQTGGGLLIGATSTSLYGNLIVSGTASLTGGSITVVPIGANALAAGQTYTIVQAGDALTASGVTASATGYTIGLSTITSAGFNDLILTLNSGTTPPPSSSYTELGLATGGAAVGTGAALDQVVANNNPTSTAFVNTVLVPLAALPHEQQQTAITQLSPSQLTPQVVTVATSPALNAIVEHQEIQTAALDGNNPERGLAAGSGAQTGALWGQVLANTASRDSSAGASAYNADTYGLMFGFDAKQSEQLLLGAAVSWVTSQADGRDALAGSNTHLNSYQGLGYGTWRPTGFNNRLAIDGQVGFGYNHYKQTRAIGFLAKNAQASYDGQQYLANLRVGYSVPIWGNATATPYFGLREIHIENPGYSEHGAGVADLRVGSLSTDSFSQEMGVKFVTQFLSPIGTILPSVKLGWMHDYTDGAIPVSGVIGGVAFTSSTTRVAPDAAIVGANLTLKRSDNFELGFEYDGEIRDNFQSHTGLAKAVFKF